MSALWVSWKHRCSARHAFIVGEVGTGHSDRSREDFEERRVGCHGSRAPLLWSSWWCSGWRLGWNVSFKIMKKQGVTLSGLLGGEWWLKEINSSTVLLILASVFACLQLSRTAKQQVHWGCYWYLHCQNKQHGTWKVDLEVVTSHTRADLHHCFPFCFIFSYFSISCM